MLEYTLRRLALTVPVLLGVATLVFALIHLVPGDPAEAMLGESAPAADLANGSDHAVGSVGSDGSAGPPGLPGMPGLRVLRAGECLDVTCTFNVRVTG